jgi:serine/threonine protein kinase/WD40 repeat protein
MQFRCPHCHEPIEVSGDDTTGLKCPACDSPFSIVPESETLKFPDSDSTAVTGEIAEQQSISRIRQFDFIEELGKGSYGTVWQATDTKLQRTVAVKIPRLRRTSRDEVSKFLREAQSVAQLKHPHIVKVYEVGQEGETPYIVSEFIEGATLYDWIIHHRLTGKEVAELCIKLCDALQHAHEQGVIHRDLKPGNILIDKEGEPHLADFGIAKREAIDTTMTLDGEILGTPAYMSPEQAEGLSQTVDRRSDIYSMGVVLFELLTGERPFRGKTRMLLQQVISAEPPRLRSLNGQVPKDLETICLKCLEKDPAKRYQTARVLQSDLRSIVENRPISARPITRVERAWRWCLRNPASAIVIVLAMCLLIGSGWVAASLESYHSRLVIEQTRASNAETRRNAALQIAETQKFYSSLNRIAYRRGEKLPGWTSENLQASQEAAARIPDEESVVLLRSEIASAVGSLDIARVATYFPFEPRCARFDHRGKRLAIGEFKAPAFVAPCRLQVVEIATNESVTFRLPSSVVHREGAPATGLVQDGIRSLAWSADDRWLLAGMRSGWVYVVDLENPQAAPRYWKASDVSVNVMIGPDGVVYTVDERYKESQEIKRWSLHLEPVNDETSELATLEAEHELGYASNQDIDLAPDSRCLIAFSHKEGPLTSLLDAKSLQKTQSCPDRFAWPQFESRGRFIAGQNDDWIEFRDPAGLRLLDRVSLRTGENDEISRVVFDSDCSVAVVTRKGVKEQDLTYAELWDLSTGQRVTSWPMDAYSAPVLDPQGRYLANPTKNGVDVFEIRGLTDDGVRQSIAMHPCPVSNIAGRRDRELLVCASTGHWQSSEKREHLITTWTADGQAQDAWIIKPGDPNDSTQLDLHPEQSWVAINSSSGITGFSICKPDGVVEEFLGPNKIRLLQFSPSDDRLWAATGNTKAQKSSDGILSFDIATMKTMSRWSNMAAGVLYGQSSLLALVVGYQSLAAGTPHGEIIIFDQSDGKPTDRWQLQDKTDPITALAWDSQLETRIAAGTTTGKIWIRPMYGKGGIEELSRHRRPVRSLVFSQDGAMLISASLDGTVRFWIDRGTGFSDLFMISHSGPIESIELLDHDRLLAVHLVGSRNVQIWNLQKLFDRFDALGVGI